MERSLKNREKKKQTWISRAPKGFWNREKISKQKKQPEEEEIFSL